MYAGIVSAIQSAKVLTTLVKAANTVSNYNDLVSAVYEVNAKLMDASAVALASQEKQAALASKVSDLEKELVQYKNWEREIERYSLKELSSGVFAYALKPGMQPEDPPHLLCANCVSNRQKSILQVHDESQFVRHLDCHKCSSKLSVVLGKRTPRIIHDDSGHSGNSGSWMS